MFHRFEHQTLLYSKHYREKDYFFQFLNKRFHTPRNTQAILLHLQLASSSSHSTEKKAKSNEPRQKLAMA